MIRDETIKKILSEADIKNVVSDYREIKKGGFIHSIYTNENTPSLKLYEDTNSFYCFSQQKGGNVIQFVMDAEEVGFKIAVEKLAKKFNIEVEQSNGKEFTPKELEEQKHKERLENAIITAHSFYQQKFKTSKIAKEYMTNRGFLEDTLKKFEIGFASKDWRKFIDHATNYHSKVNLEQASLISKNNEGKYFDRYRNRVLFPIHSHIGHLVGFAGRTIDPKEEIKYINPSNGLLYQKSQTIFGLYQATKAIKKCNEIYVVEGYTDVLRFHQLGASNVVSLSGTNLSTQQIALLKRYAKNITLCLDGDVTGQKATLENIDKLLKKGFEVRVILFPAGEDPDSFGFKMQAKYKDPLNARSDFKDYLLAHKENFIKFKAKLFAKIAGDDITKQSELMNQLAHNICEIPDSIKRELYRNEACDIFPAMKKFAFTKVAKQIEEDRKADAIEKGENYQENNQNIIYIIEKYFAKHYNFRINSIEGSLQAKLRPQPKKSTWESRAKELDSEKYKNIDVGALYIELLTLNLQKVSESLIETLLKTSVERYNPFQEYFENLYYDGSGKEHIKEFASCLPMNAPDKKFLIQQLPKWMARVVASCLDDKYYNKQAIIFIGPQHNGKTHLCRFFTPKQLEKYRTEFLEVNSKDTQIAIGENMFVNIEEIDKMREKDVAAMKSLMSIDFAKVRPPFERKAQIVSRRASFLGNTNNAEFLKDNTGGSSRWLCFDVIGKINWKKYEKLGIEKLWAYAYHLYQESVKSEKDFSSLEMTGEEMEVNNERNKKYYSFPEEMVYISRHYQVPDIPEKAFNGETILQIMDSDPNDSIIMKNATEIKIDLEEFYAERSKKNLKLSSKNIGNVLNQLGFRNISDSFYKKDRYKRYVLKSNIKGYESKKEN